MKIINYLHSIDHFSQEATDFFLLLYLLKILIHIKTQTSNIFTFIPSNLDKARRGLNALKVLRDFRLVSEEQGDESSETEFRPQETKDSCIH